MNLKIEMHITYLNVSHGSRLQALDGKDAYEKVTNFRLFIISPKTVDRLKSGLIQHYLMQESQGTTGNQRIIGVLDWGLSAI